MAISKTPGKTTAKKSTPAKAAKVSAAPKAPAAKTAAAKKPAAAPKKAGAGTAARKDRTNIPSEQRRNYIEVAAYFIAERHGFTPGRELADWAAAEAEIDRLLAEGLLNP